MVLLSDRCEETLLLYNFIWFLKKETIECSAVPRFVFLGMQKSYE